MTTARDVLDYIEWIWHCEYVNSLSDGVFVGVAVFNSFQRTASAERGRAVTP